MQMQYTYCYRWLEDEIAALHMKVCLGIWYMVYVVTHSFVYH